MFRLDADLKVYLHRDADIPSGQRPDGTSQRPSESITTDTRSASCTAHSNSSVTPLGNCARKRGVASRADAPAAIAGGVDGDGAIGALARPTTFTDTNGLAGSSVAPCGAGLLSS